MIFLVISGESGVIRFSLLSKAFYPLRWVVRGSVLYPLLAVIYVLAMMIELSAGGVSLLYDHILLPYAWGFPHVIFFVFLLVCVGVITRRKWSASFARATAVWMFALIWTGLPDQLRYIHYSWDILSHSYSQKYNLLITLVLISSLLLFIKLAHSSMQRQKKVFAESVTIGKNMVTKISHLMWLGIFTLLLGLSFKWLDTRIVSQIYAQTIGTYLFVFGSVMLLIWHLFSPNTFIAASAVSVAVIILNYKIRSGTYVMSLLLWFPALFLGFISLFRKKYPGKLRIAALGVPVVLILIGLFAPIPWHMHFWSYYKPTPHRPDNFPRYFQAPAGATYVYFTEGDPLRFSFKTIDLYPGSETITFISQHLEKAGWKKLDYDLLNPHSPSSHLEGWHKNDYESSKDIAWPYHWSGYWINDRAETIWVLLNYRYQKNAKEDLSTLYCQMSQRCPKGIQLDYIKAYQRIHSAETFLRQ